MALQIVQDLLEKSCEPFLDHFARLGVISHVAELAGPSVTKQVEEHANQQQEKQNQQQNSEVLENAEQGQQEQFVAIEGAQSDSEDLTGQLSHEEVTDIEKHQSAQEENQQSAQEAEVQIPAIDQSEEEINQEEDLVTTEDQADGSEERKRTEKPGDLKV